MTLVTIVTPSFNQSAFLEKTICSVLEQDYPELEYFVVDGGSTDGSLAIIKKYADRLAWWASERDSGQAEAINKGLARAHGEIVAWLNSDDVYQPGAIAAAVQALETFPEAGMVYGNMLAIDENDRVTNVMRYRQLSLEDLLCFQIIGQPAVFIRRSALEKTDGLDPDFHFMLDHKLWIRIAELDPIVHVDQVWASARYHSGAKNRASPTEFGREAFRILEWAARDSELVPVLAGVRRRARASAQRVNARYLLDGGRSGKALKAWAQALLIHPPTALARLNLFGSALLNLAGLAWVRQAVLQSRRRSLSS